MNGPCAKQTTRATIIAPDGRRFVGTNDCANPQKVCPRGGIPSGVGYELCRSICQQTGHAEQNACRAAGDSARGGVLYLEGHTYACQPCQEVAQAAGVRIVLGAPPARSLAESSRILSILADAAKAHQDQAEVARKLGKADVAEWHALAAARAIVKRRDLADVLDFARSLARRYRAECAEPLKVDELLSLENALERIAQ